MNLLQMKAAIRIRFRGYHLPGEIIPQLKKYFWHWYLLVGGFHDTADFAHVQRLTYLYDYLFSIQLSKSGVRSRLEFLLGNATRNEIKRKQRAEDCWHSLHIAKVPNPQRAAPAPAEFLPLFQSVNVELSFGDLRRVGCVDQILRRADEHLSIGDDR